jgi:hypothetical protein
MIVRRTLNAIGAVLLKNGEVANITNGIVER